MKGKYLFLSIAVAIGSLPAADIAQTTATGPSISATNTTEAPRITQVVDDRLLSTIINSHIARLNSVLPTGDVADATPMNHMQLVLKPSAQRAQALVNLITAQHDPHSPNFRQWLTPQQFGDSFGVADADIEAAKSWLTSEGFAINSVSPNKMRIDFSGNAGQINRAFHTREKSYRLGNESHMANAVDISIPRALQPVVGGVVGLNDLRPHALHAPARVARWNASARSFQLESATPGSGAGIAPSPAALTFNNGTRGLVPNDLAVMYGIAPLRASGITGKGITIAVVEDHDMVAADWTNFVTQFNLGRFGGTFQQIHPAPPSGTSDCIDPNVANPSSSKNYDPDDLETYLDAEWATAIAPGAAIQVAACANSNGNGGIFIATENLIDASARPDIISMSYGLSEDDYDSSNMAYIDNVWQQADAEGISVFVSSGDSGSNQDFNGKRIHGVGISANAAATSPDVTAVGGTDTADMLDHTTSKYFSSTTNPAYGSALSYVPEIPWNESCGNGVAALSRGWAGILALCKAQLSAHPDGSDAGTSDASTTPAFISEASSGGASTFNAKPLWQYPVTNAAKDTSRDIPDVVLFGGSYGQNTYVIVCNVQYPCNNFTGDTYFAYGTSLSSPMFAGIQALMDQGLAASGQPKDQGNAAPVLYALAGKEYGNGVGPAPASLAACSADNGTNGTGNCVFHNITRGSISSNCEQKPGENTPDCFFYGTGTDGGVPVMVGLTMKSNVTAYTVQSKAYTTRPGWSFAGGLGSVNAQNLLTAWLAYSTGN